MVVDQIIPKLDFNMTRQQLKPRFISTSTQGLSAEVLKSFNNKYSAGYDEIPTLI